MIRGRANSIKKDPGLITGNEKEYAEFTKTINQFKLEDLQNNQRFLIEKLVKKQDYFRNIYEKKDFSTLSKVINTHFAAFRNLLDENQALQNDFQQNEEFLSSKKEQIRKLAKQKADLLGQNQRLKSRILTVHELNIAKHESQRTSVVNIVVEEESVRYVGKAPSEKVQMLEEKEDKYVGYKESDLPVFRRVDELISFVGEEQQRQYDFPSNSSFSFQSFGEEIKPEQGNKKYMNPPQMSKQIHSSIEVEYKEVSALKLGEVFQSRIRSTSMREPKMQPSKSFEEPDSARRSETKMLKLGSQQLESKYVGEGSPLLNCEAEQQTKEEAFQKAQAKKLNQMRKEVFKNKFRNR